MCVRLASGLERDLELGGAVRCRAVQQRVASRREAATHGRPLRHATPYEVISGYFQPNVSQLLKPALGRLRWP